LAGFQVTIIGRFWVTAEAFAKGSLASLVGSTPTGSFRKRAAPTML
jgi:hypothetical protein